MDTALVILTFCLVVATGYYAFVTGRTLKEMRKAREDENRNRDRDRELRSRERSEDAELRDSERRKGAARGLLKQLREVQLLKWGEEARDLHVSEARRIGEALESYSFEFDDSTELKDRLMKLHVVAGLAPSLPDSGGSLRFGLEVLTMMTEDVRSSLGRYIVEGKLHGTNPDLPMHLNYIDLREWLINTARERAWKSGELTTGPPKPTDAGS